MGLRANGKPAIALRSLAYRPPRAGKNEWSGLRALRQDQAALSWKKQNAFHSYSLLADLGSAPRTGRARRHVHRTHPAGRGRRASRASVGRPVQHLACPLFRGERVDERPKKRPFAIHVSCFATQSWETRRSRRREHVRFSTPKPPSPQKSTPIDHHKRERRQPGDGPCLGPVAPEVPAVHGREFGRVRLVG